MARKLKVTANGVRLGEGGRQLPLFFFTSMPVAEATSAPPKTLVKDGGAICGCTRGPDGCAGCREGTYHCHKHGCSM